MQNIFIAIIQEGFGSLSDNPPKRGDESESDEEEDERNMMLSSVIKKKKKTVKQLKADENRKKAQEAFKVLLNVNKKNQALSDDTQHQVILMDNLAKNIADSMWKLIALSEPLPSQKVNKDALKFYLATTCQIKIKEALERIKKSLNPDAEEYPTMDDI